MKYTKKTPAPTRNFLSPTRQSDDSSAGILNRYQLLACRRFVYLSQYLLLPEAQPGQKLVRPGHRTQMAERSVQRDQRKFRFRIEFLDFVYRHRLLHGKVAAGRSSEAFQVGAAAEMFAHICR